MQEKWRKLEILREPLFSHFLGNRNDTQKNIDPTSGSLSSSSQIRAHVSRRGEVQVISMTQTFIPQQGIQQIFPQNLHVSMIEELLGNKRLGRAGVSISHKESVAG